MKKLVYIAAIAFAASMVACGGEKAAETTEAENAENVNVEAEAAVTVDTVWINDTTAVVGTDTVIIAQVAPVVEENN